MSNRYYKGPQIKPNPYKWRWKMTAIAKKSEEEIRTKRRRFWWAKGHPPE
jgi:hypothetical protein